MRFSRWLPAALLLAPGLCALTLPAHAQQALIVPSCNATALPANTGYGPLTMTPNGVLCDAGGGGGGSVTQGTTPWATQETARTSVTSTTLEANHVIKASAGALYSFEVQADATLSAAAWWVMIYNATSAPADGAVTPAKCYQIPAGSPGANFAFPAPISFSTGIVIGVSTTGCFTKTASAHAFISGDF
jgi:hypothetical protein